jgi:hypothetical protein
MNKQTFLTAILLFCILLPISSKAKSNDNANVPTISVTNMDINDKTLKLNYEIRNTSKQDIWICEGINEGYKNFEVAMDKYGHTLLIRRRLNVPMIGFVEQPFGRYVRISKNEIRKESLLLPLPVHPRRVLSGGRRSSKVIEYPKRLLIEIGFYSGNMPRMIFDLLEKAEKNPYKKHVENDGYPIDVIGWLDGSVYFNEINERVMNRDEQVIIPWTDQTLKGEHVIRATITDINIPYIEYPLDTEFKLPNIYSCTKVEIEYRPSMLDYFFSNSNKKLLSNTEINYLQSQKTKVVNDKRLIREMKIEIDRVSYNSQQIVTGSKAAHVEFYNGNEHLTSFTVYGEESILTEDKQCLWHRENPQSLKMLTAEIKPFELRLQCASNIKNLWYRLRLYHTSKKIRLKDPSSKRMMIYSIPINWCDRIIRAYKRRGMNEKSIKRIHKCPGAGEGNNHYAMNPNCKPDSPGDMVLLFETKAGWNQHGGPELFTFDNHDPRGGCVLLNDGMVRFIRTKEEFQQLRWK